MEAYLISLGQQTLMQILLLSALPVLAALLVGLVISLFQAATQIQEMTLTSVPKIAAVYLSLLIGGSVALGAFLAFARELYRQIGAPDVPF